MVGNATLAIAPSITDMIRPIAIVRIAQPSCGCGNPSGGWLSSSGFTCRLASCYRMCGVLRYQTFLNLAYARISEKPRIEAT